MISFNKISVLMVESFQKETATYMKYAENNIKAIYLNVILSVRNI